jgi:hypothetical protein
MQAGDMNDGGRPAISSLSFASRGQEASDAGDGFVWARWSQHRLDGHR